MSKFVADKIVSKFAGRPWFKPADSSRQDIAGHETLSSRPMAIPAGFKRPETLAEQVARLVRSEEWRRAMERNDVETFEESDDFDVDDGYDDPSTPYEEFFDPVLQRGITSKEWHDNADYWKEQYKAKLIEDASIKAKADKWHSKLAQRFKAKPATPTPSKGSDPHPEPSDGQ